MYLHLISYFVPNLILCRLLNEAVKNLQESTVTVQEMRDEIKKEYQAGCSAKYDMIQKQEAQLAGKA